MGRIIFHIDINYFFARCEEIKNPNLENFAFVVAERSKRSVVSTSNLLARKYGIKSAMKLNNCFKLYKDLLVVKPDHEYYQIKSRDFFRCIKKFLNCDLEKMSIDECFVDVTDILDDYHGNYKILASLLRKYILKETQLHVTIGIGDTKFLAKTAGDLKNSDDNSIFKKDIESKLWTLPIENMYMVGKKTLEVIHNLNIKTIGDFVNYHDRDILKKKFMSRYDLLIELMTNGGSDEIDTSTNTRKSISCGITYENNCDDKVQIISTINELSKSVFEELKHDNTRPLTLSVTIKFKYHESLTKSKTFDDYLISENDIHNNSISIFNRIWNQESIRSISICASNLKDVDTIYSQEKIDFNHS